MSRVAKPRPLTQVMLSLRRMAEAQAQAKLRSARAELERVRLLEQQTVQKRYKLQLALVSAEQELRSNLSTTVEKLAAQADRLAQLRIEQKSVRAQESACARQIGELCVTIDELQRHLRICVARREAAELHESAERREQRRQRERRERATEEDARDRVLSATRPLRRI